MNLLEKTLNEQGLIEFSQKNLEAKDSSWFIVVFHSIGGILSGLLILFLFAIPLHDVTDSPFAMLIVGFILLAFSYFLMQKEKSDFLEYFALVFSFTAQSFIVFAFGELELFGVNTALFLLLVFQAVLFLLFNSTLHRFLSSLTIIAIGFYSFALFSIDFMYAELLLLLMTYLWLNEYRDLKYAHHLRMFAYALVVFVLVFSHGESSFLIAEIKSDLFGSKYLDSNIRHSFSLILYYGTGLGAMAMITMKYSLQLKPKLFVFLMLGTLVVYFFQPMGLSVTTPMIVLFLAFLGQNKVLWVLGTLSIVYSIFSYYNLMYIPFMHKSMQLLVFGIVVLALATLLHWYLKNKEGETHA